MAWHGCAGINLSINTPRLGVDAPAPCTVTWMAMILVRVFVDAACMMSPYGMRQRVGLVVCSESSEGLEPWKADGVGRILNQAFLGPGWHGAQIAGCHFTQFAEISGSR